MGSGSAIMFSVAHDLLHSKDPRERLLASSLLCTAGYMHWTLSHLAHHVKARSWARGGAVPLHAVGAPLPLSTASGRF